MRNRWSPREQAAGWKRAVRERLGRLMKRALYPYIYSLISQEFSSFERDMEKKWKADMAAIAAPQQEKTRDLARRLQKLEEKTNTLEDPSYLVTMDYLNFENRYRGPYAQVKKSQEIYLPYFEGKRAVLDLGCGRGEFVELLTERGIGVTGVESNPVCVQKCRERGLPVVEGDLMEYLASCQEAPDGIFAAQVAEHMSLSSLLRLCRLAYSRLREGGILVLETPNPTSLAIFTHAFYLDPSHVKPIHPELMRYFADISGFRNIQILYDNAWSASPIPKIEGVEGALDFNRAMETVSKTLFGSQDYAIIAQR